MAEERSSAEPLLTQLPTSEVKRILTDRFAADVAAASGRRIWRPLTVFGLPGLVLAGGLVWQMLDAAMTGKINAQREQVTASVTANTLQLVNAQIAGVRSEALAQVNQAFTDARGQALNSALQTALQAAVGEGSRFRRDLDALVGERLKAEWDARREQLQDSFITNIRNNPTFREAFAGDVQRVMADGPAGRGIIAGALQRSIEARRADDAGQVAALRLLASMDQVAANEGAQRLFERSRGREASGVALQSLAAVSFEGVRDAGPLADRLLDAALKTWSEYCAGAPCGPGQPVAGAMADFLRRGRELPDPASRDRWTLALAAWHEAMMNDPDAPAREPSFGMVPRALGEIGSADAIATLARWALSPRDDLAFSAALAIGALGGEGFQDGERVRLFRVLWTRVTDGDRLPAALEEAAWMALGAVSRGAARAEAGPYAAEAAVVRLHFAGRTTGSTLAAWSQGGNALLGRTEGSDRPPRVPCTPEDWIGTTETERASRLRGDLCALVALLRPARGPAEWIARRPPPVQQDRVALLGMLWALAVDPQLEGSALTREARFAPLADLLAAAQATPPTQLLAAMLILRTAPDRIGWEALEPFAADLRDASPFLAASRWLFRPMGDDHAVFAERLRAYPAPVRDAVLRALLGHAQLARPDAVGMRVTGNIGLVQGLRRNPALMANTLAFAHQVDAPLLLAAMEREGGFREVARLIADPDRAARLDLRGLERLRAQLLRDGGWEAALRDLPPATSPAALPFDFGAHGTGRFGRIRLAPGLMEAAGEATGPEEIVTLLRPATGESRVMRPGAVLHVRESDADQEWLFRLGGRGAMQLREARQEEVQPAAAPTDAELPTVVRNRVYRVAAMERNRPGWLRVTDVTPGERLEISTFGLDRSVDTTVTIVRDSERLAYDDDGGTGLESLLTWEADRPGAVFLQLNNIGRPGGFSFMVTSGM